VVLMEASCLDGSYCVFKVVLHRLRRSCRGGSSSSSLLVDYDGAVEIVVEG